MPSIVRRLRFAIVIGCLPLAAGCQLAGLTASTQPQPRSHASTITVRDRVKASSLTVIADRRDAAKVAAVVRDTVRPAESLAILAAGRQVRVVIASGSPTGASVVIPAMPTKPRAGSSPYQWSKFHERVRTWWGERAAASRKVKIRTGADVARWLDGQRVGGRLDALPQAPPADLSLGAECADGAGELTSTATEIKNGSQRILVLFVSSLIGTIPDGELNGDAVIVVTDYLPSASAASAAQIGLIRGGAVRATILGPGTPTSQVARLIAADEQLTTKTRVFPAAALFRTGSAALLPAARRALVGLVRLLRKPGATAVINGYASTTGTRRQNYLLSYARAATVASFLEARQIRSAAITVVGQGAVGPSLRDQRVTVLIEQS